MWIWVLWCFFGVSLASEGPGDVSDQSAHYDLEQLYTGNRHKEGLKLAKEKHKANPDDLDLYWMISRFLFEIGERFDRNDTSVDKVALYREMVDWADRGLLKDPEHIHLWFAKGVAMGRQSTTKGILGMLWMLQDIENAFLKVAQSGYAYKSMGTGEHLPCHAYQTLGIYYRLVPDSWFVQLLAGTRGNLDDSLKWMEKANACSPGRIGMLKELAVSLQCMGHTRKESALLSRAESLYKEALSMPITTDTEVIDLKHIPMLLEDASLACGYSRDGQQERDEKTIKTEK
jgi:hypothetical protein